MGASGAIYALYPKFLTKRNLAQSFIERMSVLLGYSISEPHLLGGLRVNICDSSLAR